MARIEIRGVMIPNDYKAYYDYFKEDSTCPADVQKIINTAPNEAHDIYINSPGGVIDVGAEIYTMLRNHSPGVRIHIVGQACSAASVAAMAGHCDMSPVALMMVHCVSTRAAGNHTDMEHCAEVLRTADDAMCQAYVQKTGMSKEEALELMERETWLTAERALELGLIDEIMFEEKTPEKLTASVGFKLPTEEQLNMVKGLAGEKPAFSTSVLQTKINLLRLTGGATT